MSLAPGARLGPYEVLAPVGAGGMGEVYKAQDTRLDRTVAIKVLPAHVANDPERKQRFEREAKTLAALSHPHICPIHDVGSQDGIDFLVMEYLEGETLAQRLTKGALPLNQALQYAIQIADALDKAHRKGIVHRDLKPGNVMLTKQGVKLLDFGLAKLQPTGAVAGMSAAATMSSPLTGEGAILGTLHYMAPEQVEGKDADARSDIFSFGTIVYEMATGKRAFEGKSAASVMAAILERQPPAMSSLQPLAPPALDHIVSRCLAKDPEERWQAAGDVMREVKWIAEAPGVGATMAATARLGGRERVAWALLAVAVLGLIAIAVPATLYVRRTAPSPAAVRLEATLGADTSLQNLSASLALSPDGSLLAFAARSSQGIQQLYIRRLRELGAVPLAGTINARNPFFSPDSQWIGFFADGNVKKIAITGGAAVTLCAASDDRGGWWGEDGSIVFQPVGSGGGLSRVSSAGGTPVPLTKLGTGEVTHRWPQVLPGGHAVLYTAHSSVSGFDDAVIVVQPLPDGTPKIVQRGGYYGRYLWSGHLVYLQQGTLFAAPFDLARLEPTGQPAPVIEDISTYNGLGGLGGQAGSAQIAWNETGIAVYLPGQFEGNDAPIEWVDRTGKVTALRATPATWSNLQFSPDGQRLAVDIVTGQTVVFTYDWARDTLTRVTFGTGVDAKPVWTPDGRRLVFRSTRNGGINNLYWQRADGSGDVQRLTESRNPQFPVSWHPGGKFLAFYEARPQTGNDLMILPMEGDEASGWKPGKPTVFLSTPFAEQEPVFSPDGRWIAYQSPESGPVDVYVRPFPGPGGRWQISTGGGIYPTWSRTSRELFYASPDNHLMVASYVVEGDSFRADKSRVWSERRFMLRPGRAFDLHPDGQRFALAAAPDNDAAVKQDRLVFIFNFFDELRRIAPATDR